MLRHLARDPKISWRGLKARGSPPDPACNEERRVCTQKTGHNDKNMTTKKRRQNDDNLNENQNDMVDKIMTNNDKLG